ncbi:ABC transporter [Streptomyces sp. NPDC058052]|uniref:ABC transporter n=1 Tax=Streptomyces sp. NPDC058052 TaxID=3346316 RepID=UPI0036F14135
MTALLRYHSALFLRSQRWTAPLLLYAALVAVGVRPGDPVLGSLGIAAAGLVPVSAWAVRICLTQEPAAARAVTAAAGGPARAHLAALLTGAGWPVFAGAVAAGAVTATGDLAGTGGGPAALAAGLLATTACALTGGAVGALVSRPFVKAPGWSVSALLLGSLSALVTTGSPAKHAVTALVAAEGAARPPWAACAAAVVLAAAAATAACRAGARLE